MKLKPGQVLPATRRLWQPLTSVERNGALNIMTHRLNSKMRIWLFFPLIVWGFTNHVTNGVHVEESYLNHERRYSVYDKLAYRELPSARVWSRPG